MHAFVNDNSQELFLQFENILSKSISDVFSKLTNRIITRFPLEAFF